MKPANKKLFYAIAVLGAMVCFTACRNKMNTTQGNGKGEIKSGVTSSASSTKPDMHNAQNSLDVAGTYKGTLPCADCEGIEVTIILNDDDTYSMTEKYLGKDNENKFKNEGNWSFLADGNTITLSGIKDASNKYKVGENTLTQLDMEGKVITGSLANNYVLKKQ